MPRIVPPARSYSRRICSNSSTLALLSTRPPLGRLSPKRSTRYLLFSRVGPNQSIEWGQIRVSKSSLRSFRLRHGDQYFSGHESCTPTHEPQRTGHSSGRSRHRKDAPGGRPRSGRLPAAKTSALHHRGAVGERTDRSQEQERAESRDEPLDAL